MILVDANLLIYAIDADSAHHVKARRWLEKMLSSDTWVGLPWIALLAFVRITTRAGIMRKPLSVEQAVGFIDSWLAQPYVTFVGPTETHWPVFRNMLVSNGTVGNLTSDALPDVPADWSSDMPKLVCNAASAASALSEPRMVRITASRLSSAILKPSRM